ncbi:hypothetical protein [Cyclobacterium qasimii]|nr:hypothetical protein [Cyclobacterium qasimii]
MALKFFIPFSQKADTLIPNALIVWAIDLIPNMDTILLPQKRPQMLALLIPSLD